MQIVFISFTHFLWTAVNPAVFYLKQGTGLSALP